MKTLQAHYVESQHPPFVVLEENLADPDKFVRGDTHIKAYGNRQRYLSFDFSLASQCPFCNNKFPRVLDFHNEAYFVCCGSTVSEDQAGYDFLCARLPEEARVIVEVVPREVPGTEHKFRKGEVPRTSRLRGSRRLWAAQYRRRSFLQRMKTAVDQLVLSFCEDEDLEEKDTFVPGEDILYFMDSRAHRLMKNQVRDARSRRSDRGKSWKKRRGNKSRQWEKRFRRHFEQCVNTAYFNENIDENTPHNTFKGCLNGKKNFCCKKPEREHKVA